MNVAYSETTPPGPRIDLNLMRGQVGPGFYREFVAEIPDQGRGGFAVVRVGFAVQNLDEAGDSRKFLIYQSQHLLCSDPADPLGTKTYDSTVSEEYPELAATPQQACEYFDPANLDWDGRPGSEIPCRIEIADHPTVETSSKVTAHCAAHGDQPFPYRAISPAETHRWFECDQGRNWIFLIDDGTDAEPQPRLVGLSGLKRALVSTVEGHYYGTGDGELKIWRYLKPGELLPLIWGGDPGVSEHRGYADDDDRGPLLTSQGWQVLDPRPAAPSTIGHGRDEPGQVYLTTTITLNGDA